MKEGKCLGIAMLRVYQHHIIAHPFPFTKPRNVVVKLLQLLWNTPEAKAERAVVETSLPHFLVWLLQARVCMYVLIFIYVGIL